LDRKEHFVYAKQLRKRRAQIVESAEARANQHRQKHSCLSFLLPICFAFGQAVDHVAGKLGHFEAGHEREDHGNGMSSQKARANKVQPSSM